MARTACLVCLVVLLGAAAKMPSEEATLVAGTYENLSKPLFFIYLWLHGIKSKYYQINKAGGMCH